MKTFLPKQLLTQVQLILIVSAFLVIADNYTFYHELLKTYSLHGKTLFYVMSTPLVFFMVTVLFFTLLASKWTTKPLLIVVLVVSSLVAYFMDTYHIIVDKGMIHNVVETDLHESLGLFSGRLVLYFFFLGILPAWFVYRVDIQYNDLKAELWSRLKIWGGIITVMLFLIWGAGNFYASLFKEHRILRDYTNPYAWIKNSISYTKHAWYRRGPVMVQSIGRDAKVIAKEGEKQKLVVFVVGEATRADHFGLNGYGRDTSPKLGKRKRVVNFPNFFSCGTYTVYSVPCMFSRYDRSSFSREKERKTENVMDILAHTGDISLLWRDNNSDPKGVMDRIGYEDYRTAENNTDCEGECRDEGMLKGLDTFVENNASKNKLIVLHIMGNHGPEYYKRYPKIDEKFTPVCRSNLLEECTQEEIMNGYDNILLYTDTFLDDTIRFLEKYEKNYDVALIYISDHGESLGEGGLYLHGMPYMLAPDAQKHIASMMWFGKGFENIDISQLKKKAAEPFSHDNIFNTLLGIFNVKTSLYDKKKDMLHF